MGKPVLVNRCTGPSQNGRIRGVLSGETCLGGQMHKTLPEWPNQGVLSREVYCVGQLHRTVPEWPNHKGSVWGNLFWKTTPQNPPRMAESKEFCLGTYMFWLTTAQGPTTMAESGGLCLGKPVLLDNCTGPPRMAESGVFCLGEVDRCTEPSQNG